MLNVAVPLVTFALLLVLYYSHLPLYASSASALLLLAFSGIIISRVNKLEGFYGLYMLKTQRGIALIDSLSGKHAWLWNALPEWGGVLGLGLLSGTILRIKPSKAMLLLGIISAVLVAFVVIPNTSLFITFLNLPGLNGIAPSANAIYLPSLSAPIIILVILSIIGGVLFLILGLLLFGAASILSALFVTVSTIVSGNPNYAALSQQLPGVAPIIPGLTIPLFSGILSLALVLIVHESLHGVIARRFKVRLKSVGLLPFGIIPIGAFVEPEEKDVSKLKKQDQNRIFIAGISSNFVMVFIFFVLTSIMLVAVMPAFFHSAVIVQTTIPGYPAYNVIAPGSQVYYWNSVKVSQTSQIEAASHNSMPFATVAVNTSEGNYLFHTNATGKIGVYLEQTQMPNARGIQNGIISFLYSFFVISFVINLFVGGMNLLPLPMLDGWRIYKNRIKSRKMLHAIGWAVLIIIIILALPWIWL